MKNLNPDNLTLVGRSIAIAIIAVFTIFFLKVAFKFAMAIIPIAIVLFLVQKIYYSISNK